MPLPSKIAEILNSGWSIAAELPSSDAALRAYIKVIPQVPSVREHPDMWTDPNRTGALPYAPLNRLRSPASITGYEIRYIVHRAEYTDTDWGWDYDLVLDDKTTRVRRTFVAEQEGIQAALLPWLDDPNMLRDADDFDSSLVNSPIDAYLNRPDDRPHLWL